MPQRDFLELLKVAEEQGTTPLAIVEGIIETSNPVNGEVSDLNLLVPIEAQEVWASGVTYERSLDVRNFEATGGKLNCHSFV